MYPEIKFYEALQEEKEKLQIELERSRSNNDPDRCRLIEHLIGVTESVVNTIPSKKVTKMLVNEPAIVISGWVNHFFFFYFISQIYQKKVIVS